MKIRKFNLFVVGLMLLAIFGFVVSNDVEARGRPSRPSRPSRSSKASKQESKPSISKPKNQSPKSSSKSWSGRNIGSKAPSKASVDKARARRKATLAKKNKNGSAKTVKTSSSKTSSALAKRTKTKGKPTQTLASRKQKAAQKATKESLAKMKSDPKIAKQYTTRYSKKPSVRPSHVPQKYNHGGNTYNISYNSTHGGYGYMGGSGWIFYNALEDTAMYPYFSSRHSRYAYDEASMNRRCEAEARAATVEAEALIAAGRADEAAELLRARRDRRVNGFCIFAGVLMLLLIFGLVYNFSNRSRESSGF